MRFLSKIGGFFLILSIAQPAFAQFFVGRIDLPGGSDIWDVAVYQAGEKFFIHEYTTDQIFVYNSRTLAYVEALAFSSYSPYRPKQMVIAEDRGLLFVDLDKGGSTGDSIILVFNADTLALETTIPLDRMGGLTVDENHNRLYVGASSLTALDLTTYSVLGALDVKALMGDGLMGGVGLNPATGELCFSNLHYDKFLVVNGPNLTGELISAPGSRGWGGTWNFLENKIYITTVTWNGYFIYDRDTGASLTTSITNDGTSLFFNPATNRVYSSAEVNHDTTVIDGVSDAAQNVEMPEGSLVSLGFLGDRHHAVFAGIGAGVHFLDESTLTIAKSFPENAGGCYELAVDPQNGRIFLQYDNYPSTDYVLVFDDQIPEMTVTAPNGGESWGVGSSQNIAWTDTGSGASRHGSAANVKIEYSTDNGVTWTTITTSTPNTGSFSWIVPNFPSISCLVRVTNADSAYLNGDQSDQKFSIDDISIGEAVDRADLTWKTGGYSPWDGENAVFFYGGDAAQSGPVSGTNNSYIQTTIVGPGTLSFYWKVSSWAGAVGNPLRFLLDSVEEDQIAGEVDWEQKTYPIPIGTHALKWVYTRDYPFSGGSNCGWVDRVEFTPAALTYTISGTVTLGGVPLPNVVMAGLPGNPATDALGAYTATVDYGWSGTATPTKADHTFSPSSRSYTNVVANQLNQDYLATLTASMMMTSPNGGEIWSAGSSHPVTWTANGVASVKLEYSTDGGTAWSTIVASTANDGTHPWTVPNAPSANCLVRASDASNAAVSDVSDAVFTITGTGLVKDDLLGTWDGQGVYVRNSDTGAWTPLATPADLIAAGDLGEDGLDDLVGIWPGQSGVWTRSSVNGAWNYLGSSARHIGAGDMNGDGRVDFLGTWDGDGVYYKNAVTGIWVKMATPADLITAGDLDGDSTDDLIGVWAGQAGVWVKSSLSGEWSCLGSSVRDIAAGDMNGDGRADLVGTWDGQGVFYRDSISGAWVQLATPADQIATGDLDGDGTDDLIGIWAEQAGVWVKYSLTETWAYIGSASRDIGAGKFSGGAWAANLRDILDLEAPMGGVIDGPPAAPPKDLFDTAPGGRYFNSQVEGNLKPQEYGKRIDRIPGPGDLGFRFAARENLIPRSDAGDKENKTSRIRS
jgi:hypothetical protein